MRREKSEEKIDLMHLIKMHVNYVKWCNGTEEGYSQNALLSVNCMAAPPPGINCIIALQRLTLRFG